MKTDPKNQERVQGLQLHPEQTSPNTNPRQTYVVTVWRIDYRETKVRIWGKSQAEAKIKAKRAAVCKASSQWHLIDRKLRALDAKLMEGGLYE